MMEYIKKESTGLTLLIIGANFEFLNSVGLLFGIIGTHSFYLIQAISSILCLVGFIILNREFKERLYVHRGHLSSYKVTFTTKQPIARVCPQCKRILTLKVKFCPYCGKELE